MKISYNWLQKYFNEKLPEPSIIADGIIFHAFEVEEIEKVGDDTIFEIKILPDRAHDCLSHWGIAKEVSTIFNIKINDILEIRKEALQGRFLTEPSQEPFLRQGLGENLQIQVLDNNCRRYMGRIVKGIKVGASPAWLSIALESIGQKSINNIVDATNYVMFDLGNPIHAFDLDKLASPKIIVDKAKDGEKFILLDGKEVILDGNMLTIRDEKEVLVVAGIKGGKKAEIDNQTQNIMIEVANFDPTTVRKTAKKLCIFTESAKRFENEISPVLAPLAMEKITNLIIELSQGEAYEVVDVYEGDSEIKTISFTGAYVNNILGLNLSQKEITEILTRFGYEYKNEEDNYEIKAPPLRLDMTGPHDIAEEIGRIYGYDKITPVLPKFKDGSWDDYFKNRPSENKTWANINLVRNHFINDGYKEVMNYSFANKGDVEIMASASDKNFMRTNLTDGVKKSFELNKLNLSLLGETEVKIFEIGTIFPKGTEIINVCFANKKEIKEMRLEEFVLQERFLKETPQEGRFLKEPSQEPSLPFKMWSAYPFISRDIAIWVPNEVESYQVHKVIKENAGELLVKEPYLFDSFTKPALTQGGESRTSYAYRLVFQSYDKTLTDLEINPIMEKINIKINSLGWEVR